MHIEFLSIPVLIERLYCSLELFCYIVSSGSGSRIIIIIIISSSSSSSNSSSSSSSSSIKFIPNRIQQYNTMQCNTMHYNTIQYNIIQYNAIQYNTKYMSSITNSRMIIDIVLWLLTNFNDCVVEVWDLDK